MTTDTTTQAVTALLDGVTPPNWSVCFDPNDTDPPSGFRYSIHSDNYGCVGYWTGHKSNHKDERWYLTERDARFIAAARDLVPALLAERDALAAQLAAAETRARESALQALAAYGQAADAHEAQLAAEAKLAHVTEERNEAEANARYNAEYVDLVAKYRADRNFAQRQVVQVEAERDRWKEAYRCVSRELNIVVPDNDRLKAERDEAEAKLATARREALEEAARVVDNSCDEFDHPATHYTFGRIAAAIRALAKGGANG